MKNNGFAWRAVARAFDYMRPGIGACLLLLATCPALPLPANAADVYVARSPEGVPAYTNRPQDASYRLFIKGGNDGTAAHGAAMPLKESLSLRQRREALEPLIQDVSARHGLDPALLRAVAHVESQFDSRAVSPAGATGLMQLMPATARRYGSTNRRDAAQNLDAGARYLKDLLDQYAGNLALALAAYNAGESNVERHARRVPPFRETMLYVPEVLTRYESYRQADAAKTR